MRAISSRMKIGAGLILVVMLGLVMPQSQATFPGSNGQLTWIQGGNLWTSAPNGTQASKLLDNADHPAWSVDGASLIFARQVNGSADIVTAFADGRFPNSLTSGAADDIQPAWAPDNARIVFASNRVDNEYRLYRMNADGSGVVPLTNGTDLGAGTDDNAPEWSPNGQRIVFQRGNGEGGSRIYVMNADGTGVTALSGTSSPDTLAYNKLLTPKWSPNGAKIAFAADTAGCDDRIFVMDANGANPDDVPVSGCVAAEPTWSPDGAILLFRLTEGPTGDGLYGYRASDNTVARLIAGADATSPDWQPIGGTPVTSSTSTSSTSSTSTSTTTTTTVVPPVAKQARPLVVRSGRWYLRNTATTGNADITFDYGNPTGDLAVTGDWDANGSTTPGVVRAGTWYLRNSNTSGVADITFAYGNPDDVPVAGDWDGNGTFTPGVVRDGIWYLRNTNSTGVADITFAYGNPGDVPVAGDWDGTVTATPGVVRDGIWYLRNSNSTGVADATFGYGNPGDIPLPGDWDGNGTTTPGVVRSGFWYLRNTNTTGNADVSFAYGDPGDKPLTWRTG